MEVVLDVVVGNEDPVIKTTSEMHVAPQISKAASRLRKFVGKSEENSRQIEKSFDSTDTLAE